MSLSSRSSFFPSLALAALAAVAVPTVLAEGVARAQRGVEVETFRPALDGYGIFSVERADTAPAWDFGFQLTIDYASQPLRLAMKSGPGDVSPSPAPLLDYQVVTHFGAHVGLAKYLELAVEIPIAAQGYSLTSSGKSRFGVPLDDATGGPTGFFAAEPRTNVGAPDAAPLDPRLALKLRAPRIGPLGLAVIAAVTLPFGDDSAFLGQGGFTFRPTAVIDVTRGRFTAAINVGAIIREKRVVLDPVDVVAMSASPSRLVALSHELTASAAVAVRIVKYVGLAAEAYSLIPLTADSDSDSDGSGLLSRDYVLDVLGGVQIFPTEDLKISVGGGGGLLESRRHDAFRVFAGLAWTPTAPSGSGGPAASSGDRDGDGIPDALDRCPTEPEDKDGFEDADGCPDPDNDGDGIPDAADRCPNQPEDVDGWEDDDGCPDPDNDGDGIPDVKDRCPDEAEDVDGFDDQDGCPDPDNDGDGIPDVKDRCPNEPETFNGLDDEDGCPDGLPAPINDDKEAAPAATQQKPAEKSRSEKRSHGHGHRDGGRQ